MLLTVVCHVMQLLRNNETVLLYPGGAREALHHKGEEYKLFWSVCFDVVAVAVVVQFVIDASSVLTSPLVTTILLIAT